MTSCSATGCRSLRWPNVQAWLRPAGSSASTARPITHGERRSKSVSPSVSPGYRKCGVGGDWRKTPKPKVAGSSPVAPVRWLQAKSLHNARRATVRTKGSPPGTVGWRSKNLQRWIRRSSPRCGRGGARRFSVSRYVGGLVSAALAWRCASLAACRVRRSRRRRVGFPRAAGEATGGSTRGAPSCCSRRPRTIRSLPARSARRCLLGS